MITLDVTNRLVARDGDHGGRLFRLIRNDGTRFTIHVLPENKYSPKERASSYFKRFYLPLNVRENGVEKSLFFRVSDIARCLDISPWEMDLLVKGERVKGKLQAMISLVDSCGIVVLSGSCKLVQCEENQLCKVIEQFATSQSRNEKELRLIRLFRGREGILSAFLIDYVSKERIAEGEWGSVFAVKDLFQRRLAVVKFTRDASAEMCKREFYLLQEIHRDQPKKGIQDAPYHLFTYEYEGVVAYIAPQYECNLLKLIEQKSHSWKERAGFGQQLLEGVSWLHKNGIVHGNIKPEHIVIRGDQCMIAAFGTARRLDQQRFFFQWGICSKSYSSEEDFTLFNGYVKEIKSSNLSKEELISRINMVYDLLRARDVYALGITFSHFFHEKSDKMVEMMVKPKISIRRDVQNVALKVMRVLKTESSAPK